MLSLIIQTSIISIIFIFLVHHLLYFFKTTLTVPKIKDLVDSPSKKYQHIFDIISNDANTNLAQNTFNTNQNTDSSEGYTELDLLPSVTEMNTSINANTQSSMKDELKHFLKKQLSGSSNGNSSGTELETVSSSNYASFY